MSAKKDIAQLIADMASLCNDVPDSNWGTTEVTVRLGDLSERCQAVRTKDETLQMVLESFSLQLDALTNMNVAMMHKDNRAFDRLTQQAQFQTSAADAMLSHLERKNGNDGVIYGQPPAKQDALPAPKSCDNGKDKLHTRHSLDILRQLRQIAELKK